MFSRLTFLLVSVPLVLAGQRYVNANAPSAYLAPARSDVISYSASEYGLTANNARLIDIVAWAFDLGETEVSAPDWFRSDKVKYDVNASGREGLQKLLVERFSMTWHRESRATEVFVIKRPSGSGGPAAAEQHGGAYARIGGTSPVVNIRCWACTLDSVLKTIKYRLRFRIEDNSGLGGQYQFQVQFHDDDPESMIRAFRESLNLDVVREYRPREALVIDAAIMPPQDQKPEPVWACEAPAGIRQEIERLPDAADPWLTFAERMKPRLELARQYPRNMFVLMAVQDAIRRDPSRAAAWDAALETYRKLDHPVVSRFLEARLRAMVQPKAALNMLDEVLAAEPSMPWAHLTALEAADAGGHTAVAERHLREFRSLCKNSRQDFPYYRSVQDAALLADASHRAGSFIWAASDSQSFALWPAAWELVYRTAAEQSIRPTFRLNITRLRALNLPSDFAWIQALRYAYRRDGDQAGLDAFEAWLRETRGDPPASDAAGLPAAIEQAARAPADQVPDLVAQGLHDAEFEERYRLASERADIREAARKRLEAVYAEGRRLLAAK